MLRSSLPGLFLFFLLQSLGAEVDPNQNPDLPSTVILPPTKPKISRAATILVVLFVFSVFARLRECMIETISTIITSIRKPSLPVHDISSPRLRE